MFTHRSCVSVALPVPRQDVFTYALPEEAAHARAGCRVLVPLGKRILTGTIVAMDVEAHPKVRPILELLDDEPAFPAPVLSLTRWMAEYYLCSWGEALHAALPSGLSPEGVIRVSMLREPTDEEWTHLQRRAPKRAALLEALHGHTGDVTVAYLQKKLDSTTIADQLDALQRAGLIRIVTDIEAQAGPKRQKAARIASALLDDDQALRNALDQLDHRAPKQSLLLSQLYLAAMRGEGPSLRSQLLQDNDTTASALDALVKKGLVDIVEIDVVRDHDGHRAGRLSSRDETDLELTPEQRTAVDAIVQAIDAKTFVPFLLDGITGSGKTLVYQRVIAHVLEQGRTALLLVPEISLTPQLSDRFRAMFGERVALLHSRMSVGERADTWRSIKDGTSPLVIGARSAIFAPLPDVGIVIVDEEHESTYKQDDPAPRYHGRDAAVMRANLEACPVVLGSATPSLETIHNVNTGRYHHLRLTTRVDGAIMPSIRVVDMRTERKANPATGAYSPMLLHEIEQRILRKEGSLVFLNRRGYSAQLQCTDCGDVPMCMNCDVALTYHKASFSLRCHYCGYAEPVRTVCTTCGGISLRETGTGTQRIEEELADYLRQHNVDATIHRMDADSTTRRGAHRTILQRFSDGGIDVLIGTQMIAKGLDIGRVTLVGVVNADQQLHQSDFRAAERTVQLLTQVSGRAGRTADKPGEVVIQTSSPDHPAVVAAVTGNYAPWLEEEFASRREAMYPPYVRFVVIELSGLDEAQVAHHARIVQQLIPERTEHLVRLPAVVPTIARLRNRYRQIIVVKGFKHADPSGRHLRAALNGALDAYHSSWAAASIRVTVDVDASGSL